MAFTRWDPLRDLLALHEQIGQLVGTDAPGWNPPVDLYETAGSFVLTAEVAGLSRSDIDIHAEESRIVIRGERSHVSCPVFAGAAAPPEGDGHAKPSVAFGVTTTSPTLQSPLTTEQVRRRTAGMRIAPGTVAEMKLFAPVFTRTRPDSGGRGARKINVT